ncbi:hypothetical protein TESG_02856 [Trichophyton tonsurans CBS 112818]|uniref:Uncharacterized protein n=1 Tax=Trichophyton tonsurans (strain CBS 112818) TaxID=647933 RepID=F2RVM1_TRIT1|nr:hypothetical protein TESG_02856 [Trichophyton tonsurans CBS 112818]
MPSGEPCQPCIPSQMAVDMVSEPEDTMTTRAQRDYKEKMAAVTAAVEAHAAAQAEAEAQAAAEAAVREQARQDSAEVTRGLLDPVTILQLSSSGHFAQRARGGRNH